MNIEDPPTNDQGHHPPTHEQNPGQLIPPQVMMQPGGVHMIYPPSGGVQVGQPYQMPIFIMPANQPQAMYYPAGVYGMPQNMDHETILKYSTQHYISGFILVSLGIITALIDPLIPISIYYPHSIFPAALFMIISGSCSMAGSSQNMKCFLVVSMVFDILANLNFLSGFIMAIIYLIVLNKDFQKGFAIFNAIYCLILSALAIYDSVLKCGDTCCGTRSPRTVPSQHVFAYGVPTQPVVNRDS